MLVNNLIKENKQQIEFAGFSSEIIKYANDLLQDKIKTNKVFITEGMWAIPYLIKNKIKVNAVIFDPNSIKTMDGFNAIKYFLNKTKIAVISTKILNKLTNRNDDNGIFVIGELTEFDFETIYKKNKSIICVLDGIEKSGNIGTILRTCDGANIDGVIVVNRRAKLTNTKSVKGSMGAIFKLPIKTFNSVKDCWQELNKFGYNVYLADTNAQFDYFNAKYDNKVALVMGSERYGISKDWYELKHKLIKIKMLGDCDSLNVGVATSILLYDIKMKQLGD